MSTKFDGIKEGDIVRIKFKSMSDITKYKKITGKLQYLSEYDIGGNINALLTGGDYVVVSMSEPSAPTPYMTIDNHHDGGVFSVYEEMIETIETIEVANKFLSETHGVLIIQVEDKLYINGELLQNNSQGIFNLKAIKSLGGVPASDEEEIGELDQFTQFMEKWLVAKAFEGSLDDDDGA